MKSIDKPSILNTPEHIRISEENFKHNADLATNPSAALPAEMMFHLMTFLNQKELGQAKQVARQWNELGSSLYLKKSGIVLFLNNIAKQLGKSSCPQQSEALFTLSQEVGKLPDVDVSASRIKEQVIDVLAEVSSKKLMALKIAKEDTPKDFDGIIDLALRTLKGNVTFSTLGHCCLTPDTAQGIDSVTTEDTFLDVEFLADKNFEKKITSTDFFINVEDGQEDYTVVVPLLFSPAVFNGKAFGDTLRFKITNPFVQSIFGSEFLDKAGQISELFLTLKIVKDPALENTEEATTIQTLDQMVGKALTGKRVEEDHIHHQPLLKAEKDLYGQSVKDPTQKPKNSKE